MSSCSTYAAGAAVLRQWGLQLDEGEELLARAGYLAGPDAHRRDQLRASKIMADRALQQFAEQGLMLGGGLTRAVRDFHRNWGKFRIEARPSKPVGLLSLMFVPPDQLARFVTRLGPGYSIEGTTMPIVLPSPLASGDSLELEVDWSFTVLGSGGMRMPPYADNSTGLPTYQGAACMRCSTRTLPPPSRSIMWSSSCA